MIFVVTWQTSSTLYKNDFAQAVQEFINFSIKEEYILKEMIMERSLLESHSCDVRDDVYG